MAATETRRLKVLLVDDHRLMVEAVRLALEHDGDFEIVGATTDPTTAVGLVTELRPDIVLLDVMMPALDGLACLSRIRHRDPDVKVVMLSANDDPAIADHALQNGANAYVMKQIDPRDLGAVLRQVMAGDVVRTTRSGTSAAAAAAATASDISRRELDVLQALSRGLSNQQIAAELFLAEQTVKFHLSNIFRKLEVRNRTEAVQTAIRQNLVSNPIFDRHERG
jgi:DNA-binding NarL/FixJ family response regulator